MASIPWNTPVLWRDANESLKHTLQRNGQKLGETRCLAHGLRARMTALFPVMDGLCRDTCTACTDICCQRAWVWFDFKDLIFLHLAGIPVPDQQLLNKQENHCRYISPDGCCLDRIQRPFVCTWYLCPQQTQRLRQKPAAMKRVQDSLQQIKGFRQKMETTFIRAVA